MLLKSVGQLRQAGCDVIMAHGATDGFPDMFLGVEIRSGHREMHSLQPWVSFQNIAYGLSSVPRCAIPKKQNGDTRQSGQDLLDVLSCCFTVQDRRAHGYLFTRKQIQCAVEVDLLPTWMRPYHRRLAQGCPHRRDRRLQIEPSFIFRQEYRLGCRQDRIDDFFSSCSSNSAILASERDLYTLAGRW